MSRAKKILALSLVMLTLLPFAAACNTKTTEPQNTTAPTADDTLYVAEYLPEMSCNGYTYRIVDIDDHPQTVEADPVTVIDQAIYKRNETVKTRYDIDIETRTYQAEFWWHIPDLVAQLSAAESAEYELITQRFLYAYQDVINGDAVAACNLPTEYVDMSRPWHKQQINETVTFDGVALMDFTAFDVQPGGECLFFNKSIVDELNLTSPYELVDSGAWTYDEMWKMARAAASNDLDGSPAWTESDRYGFFINWHELTDVVIAGTNHKLINMTGSTPSLNRSEGLVNQLINAVGQLEEGVMFDVYEAWGMLHASNMKSVQMFSNGQCMFVAKNTDYLRLLGDMQDDYGILPYPKENADQESYHTPTFGFIAQPLSCHPDLEFVCIVKEALAVETLNYYDPAYYENTIQNRYLRTQEDLKYLKLITDSAAIDLGLSVWWVELRNPLAEDVMAQYSTGFASKLEALAPTANQLIDTLSDFVASKK